MSTSRVVRNIAAFLSGILSRDRYLMELLAACVTFGVGVLASVYQAALEGSPSMSGFRDMPCPEGWVIAFAVPGIWASLRLWWEGERHEGRVSLGVMGSFVALGIVSMALDLDNWGFWAMFALLLGVMKTYALIREWGYLRWGVAVMGAFFWISLTLSIAQNSGEALPLAIAPYSGFAAANLLSVWRARGKRGA